MTSWWGRWERETFHIPSVGSLPQWTLWWGAWDPAPLSPVSREQWKMLQVRILGKSCSLAWEWPASVFPASSLGHVWSVSKFPQDISHAGWGPILKILFFTFTLKAFYPNAARNWRLGLPHVNLWAEGWDMKTSHNNEQAAFVLFLLEEVGTKPLFYGKR